MQNSHLTFQGAADRYCVSMWIIKKIADRLQLGFKSGSYWFFCHGALQNQPLVGASKPATILTGFGHVG
jgi:hypothetical protein